MRVRPARHRLLLTVALCLMPATGLLAEAPNTLSPTEVKEGWKLLFDGTSTTGWRNYKKDAVGPGWQVVDGELRRVEKGAGDIITADEFGAFEVMLDYKISPEGNSGLMFHVTEENPKPWQSGPEIQIQDNVAGHDPEKAGWLYQLYKPDTDATKPAGEWNTLRVLITPTACETSMNGVKYYSFVKGGPEWNERVGQSKFSTMPAFGKATKGHLALQDHGDLVSFRNIKIRPLDAKVESK
jgi:hypothetical protein